MGWHQDGHAAGELVAHYYLAADDEDMQIEVKFDSSLTQQYQAQGIIVEQDVNAWMRLSLHSDGTQVFAFAASASSSASISGVIPAVLREARSAPRLISVPSIRSWPRRPLLH